MLDVAPSLRMTKAPSWKTWKEPTKILRRTQRPPRKVDPTDPIKSLDPTRSKSHNEKSKCRTASWLESPEMELLLGCKAPKRIRTGRVEARPVSSTFARLLRTIVFQWARSRELFSRRQLGLGGRRCDRPERVLRVRRSSQLRGASRLSDPSCCERGIGILARPGEMH